MNSPFPPSTAAPGEGRIVAARTPNGEPGLEVVAYQYPLKLIAPTTGAGLGTVGQGAVEDDGAVAGPARKKSALVFLLSYGGGLVAGDQVTLAIEVRAGARLSLVTQGTTKVFKARGDAGGSSSSAGSAGSGPSPPTRQTLTMHVAPGAALCLLPDPVQPFADSVYEQVQVVRLQQAAADGKEEADAGAQPSLCLLDWVIQGRAARGENWSLASWKGRNEVWLTARGPGTDGGSPKNDRLLVRDAVMLAPGYLNGGSGNATPLRDALHGLAVFGTLILRGPLVDALGRFFLGEFAALPRLGARDFRDSDAPDTAASSSADRWRADRLRLEQAHGVLWSAAAVRSCVVVKFGARSVEGARLWIGSMLQREGSVATAFGDEALMCVR